MEWIGVKDRLPKHQETILARSHKGYCVVVFIDSKAMNEELSKTPYANECVDLEKNPFYFVSQEVKRATLNGVTHWMQIPTPKEVVE